MTKLPRLIGVIHLPALPGAPGTPENQPPDAVLNAAGSQALREARLFEKAGFDGLILENFGDAPFFKDQVPPETIASLAIIAAAVRESAPKIKVGINVLRNDAKSALAIAAVTGCDFIRVNVLSGVAATDQGLIEGRAAELSRFRRALNSDVAILADVHVKHAVTLSSQDWISSAYDTLGRGGAQAVILTGSATGEKPPLELLQAISKPLRTRGVPLYLGSGIHAKDLSSVRKWIDGVIVSSSLRSANRAGASLMPAQVKAFSAQWKRKPSR